MQVVIKRKWGMQPLSTAVVSMCESDLSVSYNDPEQQNLWNDPELYLAFEQHINN